MITYTVTLFKWILVSSCTRLLNFTNFLGLNALLVENYPLVKLIHIDAHIVFGIAKTRLGFVRNVFFIFLT